VALGNTCNRRPHRRSLIGANRKNLAARLAIIEDRRLIGRTVSTHHCDLLALGQIARAGLQEFEVARRRGGVALAELVTRHNAEFGDVADHRHVAPLALIRSLRLAFFRHNLRRVDVERIVSALITPQHAAENTAMHPRQSRQATRFVDSHAP
jgi:hypothetical protein